MAFWTTDIKPHGSPNDVHNGVMRDVNDAVTCGCSINFCTPETAHDKKPSRTENDDNVPSPGTPLRERRLPASFWQEPNVPRRTVRTSPWRSESVGRISPATRLLHRQPSFDCCQPAALLHRRQFHYPSTADLAFSTWRGTERHHPFLQNWKDAPTFNFDVPTKPQPVSSSAVDFVRNFAHLAPLSVVNTGLPDYPLVLPDYAAGHGGSLGVHGPSEELAATSAAVVAAYLRWRAAEEGSKPAVEPSTSRPSVGDWSSMMWRQCSTAATSSLAVQRLHRYHPY